MKHNNVLQEGIIGLGHARMGSNPNLKDSVKEMHSMSRSSGATASMRASGLVGKPAIMVSNEGME